MVQIEQSEVLNFLGSPAAYDPPPPEVDRIDTHISAVFLAGARVYKVKRAVRYAFLDFSTLERRRSACLHELAINRRTAPELYLEVTPITASSGGGLHIGGDGEVVEWALVMRRFDQAKLYDHMARKGELPLAGMPRLARAIATFHRGADRFLAPEQALGRLEHVLDENAQSLASLEAIRADATLAALVSASRRAFASLGPLLQARARQGYVRHCHGDLHLRNIVEIDGAPVLFDAIEFDDGMAIIDVLYDLAFLLMDLGAHGLLAHANSVLNAYLEGSGDTGNLLGLRLLPLFLSMRAAIRAKVELLRASHGDSKTDHEARERAANYCRLALDHLIVRAPRLIAIGGLSGSGKSTVARALAPKLGNFPGAVHIRSDMERKRLFGCDPGETLPQSAYSREITELVYATCRKRALLALQGGQTVIVDAVHASENERAAIAAIATRAGVDFTGLWLDGPRHVLRERVARRSADVSDATPKIVDRQFAYHIGRQDFAVIDANRPLEQVIAVAFAWIGEIEGRTWLTRFAPGEAEPRH